MKKNLKIGSMALVILGLTALGLVLTAFTPEAKGDVSIDFKFNVAKEDTTNYFNWTLGKNAAVKDSLDAATGASAKASTAAFNSVRFDNPDSSKKAAIPLGLRGLLLYPISKREIADFDALRVSENKGIITVRFVHRGTAYELQTDRKGEFDVLTGAKLATGVADNNMNVFTVKDGLLKENGDNTKMSDLDWSAITLIADRYAPDASRHYEGTLKFGYKNDILTIKGKLKEK